MATEFKSQICTTVEQSDRLLGLDLKPETADMHYLWGGYWHLMLDPWEHAVGDYPFDFDSEEEQDYWELRHLPAWSLHRLIEMISEEIQTDWQSMCLQDKAFTKRGDLYDNIVDCIEWLIKEGYLNKKYLKEENS